MDMTHKRIVVFLLSLTLIVCSTPSGISANTLECDKKITEQLRAEIELHDEGELIPVTIWFYDNVDHDANNFVATAAVGMDPISFDQMIAEEDEVSEKIIDAYISAKRKAERESYQEYNNNLLSGIDCIEEITYVSCYSPVVVANMTSDGIFELTTNENLWFIDIYKCEAHDEMLIANAVTRVAEVSNASYYGYTGSGIKIGMVEAYVPSSSIQTSYGITIYPTNAITSYHANTVVTTIHSVAPDATFYCASISTDDNIAFQQAIEWLVTKDVNVINASASFGNDSLNSYGSTALWIDHLAFWDSVHFVKSSGNDDPSNSTATGITSPGMAYNAITVGGINDNRTTSYMDDSIYAYTATMNNLTSNMKPDIGAPCVNLTAGNYTNLSGASYAAAQVSGIVALLCQQKYQLKTLQDAVKAILCSSVNQSSSLNYVISDWDYRKIGSGLVDAVGACFVTHNTRYKEGLISAGSTKTYTLNVYQNDTRIKIALTWLKKSYFSNHVNSQHMGDPSTSSFIANLSMTLTSPSGQIIYSSNYIPSNMSYIDFDPADYDGAGAYTLKISRTSNVCPDNNVYFAVAWR